MFLFYCLIVMVWLMFVYSRLLMKLVLVLEIWFIIFVIKKLLLRWLMMICMRRLLWFFLFIVFFWICLILIISLLNILFLYRSIFFIFLICWKLSGIIWKFNLSGNCILLRWLVRFGSDLILISSVVWLLRNFVWEYMIVFLMLFGCLLFFGYCKMWCVVFL